MKTPGTISPASLSDPISSLAPHRLSLCLALALSSSALLLSACQSTTNRAAWQVAPVMRIAGAQTPAQSAESYYRLGRYHDGQNRFALAENDYRKAIQLSPAHAEARNALGVLLARQGKFEEAIAMLEEAVKQMPGRSHILSNLGHACQLAGATEQAIHYLSMALELDPNNLKAGRNLEIALQRREDDRTLAKASPLSRKQEIALDVQAIHEVALAAQQIPDEAGSARLETVEISPNIVELRTPETGVPHDVAKQTKTPVEKMLTNPAEASRGYRLEIANGMGMDGAARRLRVLLRQEGEPKARVTDQRPFRQLQTRIEYAGGYEVEAQRLATRLGGVAIPASRLFKERGTHLRVVMGKDLRPMLAALPELLAHRPEKA